MFGDHLFIDRGVEMNRVAYFNPSPSFVLRGDEYIAGTDSIMQSLQEKEKYPFFLLILDTL